MKITKNEKLDLTHSEFLGDLKSGKIDIDADHIIAMKLSLSDFASARYKMAIHAPNLLSILSIPAALAAMYFYKFSVGLIMILIVTPFLHKYSRTASVNALKKNLINDSDFYRFSTSKGGVNIRYKTDQESSDKNLSAHSHAVNASEVPTKNSTKPLVKLSNKLTLSLKAVIVYMIIYGLIVGYLTVTNLDYWNDVLPGKSLGETLGLLMNGPLLGILFFASAFGLSIRRIWGRRLAVTSLLFAAVIDIRSFAWGYSNEEPSSQVLLVSGIIFVLWTAFWFYLLFKKSSSEALY